jgi:coenzyme PQQ precursor peptide PqqA
LLQDFADAGRCRPEHDMCRARTDSPAPCRAQPGNPDHIRRHAMQWETPTAVDMRFGFEITMYIATR